MKLIKLYSDNFNGQLMEPAVYKELTLQMSTSDWHTHTKKVVYRKRLSKSVLTMDQFLAQEELANSICPCCGQFKN